MTEIIQENVGTPIPHVNSDDVDIGAVTDDESQSPPGETFGQVLDRAIDRRLFMKGTGATLATFVVVPTLLDSKNASARGRHRSDWRDPGARLKFETVPAGNEADVVVPPNYNYNVILKWGDPLFSSAPEFDVTHQTGARQEQQFGFNADLVLWFPLPSVIRQLVERFGRLGSLGDFYIGRYFPRLRERYSKRALIAVNHEYTKGEDMFVSYDSGNPTQDQVETEIASHGATIAELVHKCGQWQFNRRSAFNRRIYGNTMIEISGPLRGHEMMKSSYDDTGTQVKGMFNNCAGGKTPWGTILTCEENFDQYFGNNSLLEDSHPAKAVSKRIPAKNGESSRKWERFDSRFDVSVDPNEYNRFGYVVEIDPYDPASTPQKRTALGRFKHEGAVPSIAQNGQVAVYSGDDARYEYVYKYLSHQRYKPWDRKHNMKLLDDGTLYAARFDVGPEAGDDMGTGKWLPLVWERGNALDSAADDAGNKLFNSQTDVLLKTRLAADILGATPMDRPEDVDVHPHNKRVYVALTNNSKRTEDSRIEAFGGREELYPIDRGPNESNPRPNNQHGHVLEVIEANDDPTAMTFHWNIFIKCGRPDAPEDETQFGEIADPIAVGVSPVSDPDNIVFDERGNLWISTDGQYFSDSYGFGQNDGVFAVPTEGKDRGLLRQFLSAVPGAEVCGPEFAGDNRTFFCAIQHPRDGEAFDHPWPIGEEVAKPSLIGVQENRGRKIGR